MNEVDQDVRLRSRLAALSEWYVLSDYCSLGRLYFALTSRKLFNTLIYHFIIPAYNYSL